MPKRERMLLPAGDARIDRIVVVDLTSEELREMADFFDRTTVERGELRPCAEIFPGPGSHLVVRIQKRQE